MKKNVVPYKEKSEGKKKQVTEMFDNVSGNYDVLNKVISMGMDVAWKNNVLKMVQGHNPENILDIATGTGDMAILYAQTKANSIVGLDISSGMLEKAKLKIENSELKERIGFQLGDAENLPFEENSFDVVTVSYGIRNFEDLEKGLGEILRVLNPDGALVILETSVPEKFPLRQGYLFYTKYVLPLIGKIFSKDKRAYSYLSESAIAFPYGERLKLILEKVGFNQVQVLPQAGGISTIYEGKKS